MREPTPEPSAACAQARTAISMRHDGELPDARALEAHLAACVACRVHDERLRALDASWATLRDATPSEDVWRGIERRLPSRPAALVARGRPALLARAAAAALGVLGVAALAWASGRTADAPAETVVAAPPFAVLFRLARSDAARSDRERRFLELLSPTEVPR